MLSIIVDFEAWIPLHRGHLNQRWNCRGDAKYIFTQLCILHPAFCKLDTWSWSAICTHQQLWVPQICWRCGSPGTRYSLHTCTSNISTQYCSNKSPRVVTVVTHFTRARQVILVLSTAVISHTVALLCRIILLDYWTIL